MNSITILKWLVTVLTITSTYTLVGADADEAIARRIASRRNISRQRHRSIAHRMGAVRSTPTHSQWSMFAPVTPDPEDVDCQIEVQTVQLVGGRCVRLGGDRNMAVCQSGIHLDVWSSECPQILRAKEAAAAAAAAETESANSAGVGTGVEEGVASIAVSDN